MKATATDVPDKKGPDNKPENKKGKVPATAAKQAESAKAAASSVATADAAVEAPLDAPEDKKAAKARAKQEKAEAKALAKAEKAEAKKSAKSDKERTSSVGGSNFIMLHAEKIGLGIAVLVSAGLLFLSIGKLSLTPGQTPDDLKQRVDNIKEKIKTAHFPDNEFPVPDYEATLRPLQQHVAPDNFALAARWDQPFVPPQKRGHPKIFAVEEPFAMAGAAAAYVRQRRNAPAQAAAGAAAPGAAPHAGGPAAAANGPKGVTKPINFGGEGVPPPAQDPNAPATVFLEGRRWVALTALLPYARQRDEYNQQFANAFEHNPVRDLPIYVEVRMMRLEVPPGASEDKLDWSKALTMQWRDQVLSGAQEKQTWATSAPEMIPPEFYHDDSARLADFYKVKGRDASFYRIRGMGVLTKSPPPLSSRSLKPWINHPHLREMIASEEAQLAEAQATAAAEAAAAAEEAEKAEKEVPAPAPPVPADKAQQPGGAIDPFNNIDQRPAKPKDEAGAEKAAKPKKAVRKISAGPRKIDYHLVRLFDFNVEPGKSYRYKLQLAVTNPNHKSLAIQARNLQHPELREDPLLYSPWSQETNTVTIPSGDTVYAAEIVNTTPDAVDRAVKAVINLLNFDTGEESVGEMTLRRGALASGKIKILRPDPLHGVVTLFEDTPVQTDLVLADLHGGEQFSNELAAPSEMLFIDGSGQLIVRNSVEDESQVSLFRKLIKAFEEKPPAPAPGPGQGGPGVQLFGPAGAPPQDLQPKTAPPAHPGKKPK